jgi:hypothetical protein
MLGRNSYTPEELDQATKAMAQQISAYKKLARAVEATGDADAKAALENFEPLFFNNMTLALDRFFVHRVRAVSGKDGNPLNEVELLTDSLLGNGVELRGNNVIKLVPAQSVLKLEVGDRIRLSAAQFEKLSKAFLAEINARFLG